MRNRSYSPPANRQGSRNIAISIMLGIFIILILSILLLPVLGWFSVIPVFWAGISTACAAITACTVCCKFDFLMLNLANFIYKGFYKNNYEVRNRIESESETFSPSIQSKLFFKKQTNLIQNNQSQEIQQDSEKRGKYKEKQNEKPEEESSIKRSLNKNRRMQS